jgi:hypothetical protein
LRRYVKSQLAGLRRLVRQGSSVVRAGNAGAARDRHRRGGPLRLLALAKAALVLAVELAIARALAGLTASVVARVVVEEARAVGIAGGVAGARHERRRVARAP